jgi:2-keto-4-pentenoate hydratase/2-oxohepta-3-ene-1,7-dioic acid hydratase in catechol pathway
MRWTTVRTEEHERRPGLVVDGSAIHLLAGDRQLIDLLGDDGETLQRAGEEARADPAAVVAFDTADLAPPLQPPQIRDFLTFLDHLRNAGAAANMELNQAWNEIPAFYFSNAAAVVGPNDPVRISPGCTRFDFELEVAAVIGKRGANLHPDNAEEHIVGFSVLNDWSARDLQVHEMQLRLGPAKGKDSANTLGPMLVTKDELEPYRSGNSYHLEMTAWVNDEQVSHGFMDQMDWSWGEMLAYASRGTQLRPGDVIGSGTVPTGCLFEHFALDSDGFRGFLQPGDVVTFEVQELGRLRQTVRESLPIHRLRTGF